MRRPMLMVLMALLEACGAAPSNHVDHDPSGDHRIFYSPADEVSWTAYVGQLGVVADAHVDGHVLALAPNGEMVASSDGGESWARVFDVAREHLRIVQICPGSRLLGTVCIDARHTPDDPQTLFCSRDRGETWTSLSATLAAADQSPYPRCVEILSADAGASRIFLDTTYVPRVRSTRSPGNTCTVIPLKKARCFSDDGGTTWHEVSASSGLICGQYTALGELLIRNGTGSELTTLDWNLEERTLIAAPLGLSMAQVPAVPGHLIVTQLDGSTWYTPDAGRTLRSWTGTDVPERSHETSLYPAQSDVPIVAHVEGEAAMIRSDDLGHTWQDVSPPLPDPRCRLSREPSGVLWCAGAAMLFRSLDAGNSWGQVFSPTTQLGRTSTHSRSGPAGRGRSLTRRTALPVLVEASSWIVVARAQNAVRLPRRQPSVLRYQFRVEETVKKFGKRPKTFSLDILTPNPIPGTTTSGSDRPATDASYVLFLVEGGETGFEFADASWRNAMQAVESPVVEVPNALQHDTPRRDQLLQEIRAVMSG